MSSLPLWLASSLLFLGGVTSAAVSAGTTYCILRSRSVLIQVLADLFASLVILAFAWVLLVLLFLAHIGYAVVGLGLVLAFSIGQAFFESVIDFQLRPVTYHRGQTFVSYLCSAALGLLLAGGLGWIVGEPLTSVFLWGPFRSVFGFDKGNGASLGVYGIGYGVGFFFAPLALSYLRYRLLGLRLRFGKERLYEPGAILESNFN